MYVRYMVQSETLAINLGNSTSYTEPLVLYVMYRGQWHTLIRTPTLVVFVGYCPLDGIARLWTLLREFVYRQPIEIGRSIFVLM